jgi:hypothetical protein
VKNVSVTSHQNCNIRNLMKIKIVDVEGALGSLSVFRVVDFGH